MKSLKIQSCGNRPALSDLTAAKIWSYVALALWVVSMPLVGFVIYQGQTELSGAKVLVTGWLGIVTLNFSWLANPLFLLTFIRVQRKTHTVGMACLALLFALDTFRLNSLLLDEGGGKSAVYGYGWGFVFWMLALCAMLAAAGAQKSENDIERSNIFKHPVKDSAGLAIELLGLTLLVLVLIGSVYLARSDRAKANQEERQYLTSVAFKRGPVCSAVHTAIVEPLKKADGPLGIGLFGVWTYPFNSPTQVLGWGVPAIRVVDRDYSYTKIGDELLLTSVPAVLPLSAVLWVKASTVEGRSQVHLKLVEGGSERVVFDFSWLSEPGESRYCPSYSAAPTEVDQPRKMLIEAFGSPLVPIPVQAESATRSANVSTAVLIETSPRTSNIPNHAERVGSFHNKANRNCAWDVGWTSRTTDGSIRLDIGDAFVIGEKAYYRGKNFMHALCQNESVYLFQDLMSSGMKKHSLYIEKRSLTDFRKQWERTVEMDNDGHAAYLLDSVEETADAFLLTVSNEGLPEQFVLKVPNSMVKN